jgi:monothiol glutaredoxin
MAMNDALKQEFDDLVQKNDVVLFMKGNRQFPQCGFSATVVQILDDLLDTYETVNVLADPDVREGIKEYSEWPTIPQLYIKGEFVGGCDIIKQMHQAGDLETQLGVEPEEVAPPAITITDAAAAKCREAAEGADAPLSLRFSISSQYEYDIGLGDAGHGDITVVANEVPVVFDRGSAKRANGLVLDYVEENMSAGFSITNPNEPAKVNDLQPQELKAWMDEGKTFELFDVRTDEERETALIEGARQLNDDGHKYLMELPKDTVLVFHCHRGGRSQQAADYFLAEGFTDVYNLVGGIDGWSTTVDTSQTRY